MNSDSAINAEYFKGKLNDILKSEGTPESREKQILGITNHVILLLKFLEANDKSSRKAYDSGYTDGLNKIHDESGCRYPNCKRCNTKYGPLPDSLL